MEMLLYNKLFQNVCIIWLFKSHYFFRHIHLKMNWVILIEALPHNTQYLSFLSSPSFSTAFNLQSLHWIWQHAKDLNPYVAEKFRWFWNYIVWSHDEPKDSLVCEYLKLVCIAVLSLFCSAALFLALFLFLSLLLGFTLHTALLRQVQI